MSMKELNKIRFDLSVLAERESNKLWRLARKAQKRNVSNAVITKLREEANYCYSTLKTYPERMLEWDFEYKMVYAFKY